MNEKFLCREEDDVNSIDDIVKLILKCTDPLFYESNFFHKLDYDKVNMVKDVMHDDIRQCLFMYGEQYSKPKSSKNKVTMQVKFLIFDNNIEYIKSLKKCRSKSIGEIANNYALDDNFLKHVSCNYIITKPSVFTKIQYLCIILKV